MTIDLAEYKDNLKSKVIVGELTAIIQILDFTIAFLKIYDYYAPIKDLLMHLKDSRVIIEIHKNNHEKKVNEKAKEEENKDVSNS